MSASELAQLEIYGRRLTGSDASAAERLDPDGVEPFHRLEVWDIVDEAGALRFRAWLSEGDSGTLFRGETTEILGDVIQFGFACEDREAWEALAAADLSEAEAADAQASHVDWEVEDDW